MFISGFQNFPMPKYFSYSFGSSDLAPTSAPSKKSHFWEFLDEMKPNPTLDTILGSYLLLSTHLNFQWSIFFVSPLLYIPTHLPPTFSFSSLSSPPFSLIIYFSFFVIFSLLFIFLFSLVFLFLSLCFFPFFCLFVCVCVLNCVWSHGRGQE